MQKEILPGLLAVKVPDGASGLFVFEWPDKTIGIYTNVTSYKAWHKFLPKGNWHLLGRPGEIKDGKEREEILSLLRLHNFEPETTILLKRI